MTLRQLRRRLKTAADVGRDRTRLRFESPQRDANDRLLEGDRLSWSADLYAEGRSLVEVGDELAVNRCTIVKSGPPSLNDLPALAAAPLPAEALCHCDRTSVVPLCRESAVIRTTLRA